MFINPGLGDGSMRGRMMGGPLSRYGEVRLICSRNFWGRVFEGWSIKERGTVSWRSGRGKCSEEGSSCYILEVLKICEQDNVNELGLGMVMMALSLVLVAELLRYSAGVTNIDWAELKRVRSPIHDAAQKTSLGLCSANLLCDLAVKVVIGEDMMILQPAGTVGQISL
jgi:hypothetical protein